MNALLRCTRGFALLVVAAGGGQAQAPDSAAELVGLWKAEQRFGPDPRGKLTITGTAGGYTADIAGYTIPLSTRQDELWFELPNGDATFRGKPDATGAIRGFWLQSARGSFTPSGRTMAATPVTLVPAGPDRWTGNVAPLDDQQTFYLLVTRRSDGTLSALLRNIERDYGSLLGVRGLVRRGSEVILTGGRGAQNPDRELFTGTYDSALKVITLDFPYRGGSYDFRREDDEQSAFYPRGSRPGSYVYRVPPALNDGWPVASVEEVGIDRTTVERFVQQIIEMRPDSVNAPQVHSLLIARRGKLVVEEYFHGYHRDRLHNTRSASKSVTATIAGAAMFAGKPVQLSASVYQVMNGGATPRDLEPRKRAMTLEHLLTMTSGYFCDDNNDDAPGNESRLWEQTDEPDFYTFALKLPMASAPGEQAVYCSISSNLALGMLGRATGESPLYLFDRLLAAPLDIHHYAWGVDRALNPYGGGGMELLARDFMKFGQLMLDGGSWRGRRILSTEFVARAASPLTRIGQRGYGLLWWQEEKPYGGATVRGFAALGNGGQIVMVFPELELVVATNGGSYASGGWRFIGGDLIPNHILPAVRPMR
jgi:CubicO group peptidase (beta-lactamase class C family)